MTREDILRNELLAQRDWLAEQIQNFTTRLRAVESALAVPGPAAIIPRAENSPPPALTAPVTPPAPPAVPPVPDSSGDGQTRKPGWLMARIEQLIDESGPTFSYRTISEAYRARWNWKSYPSTGTVAMALWRIVKKRGHTIHQSGSGRRSTIYLKRNTPPPPAAR